MSLPANRTTLCLTLPFLEGGMSFTLGSDPVPSFGCLLGGPVDGFGGILSSGGDCSMGGTFVPPLRIGAASESRSQK